MENDISCPYFAVPKLSDKHMKFITKLFLSLFILTGIVFQSNGQWAEKTITTSPGYSNQIYYSMENGVVKVASNYDWDLAFTTSKQDNGIMVNHINGVEVFMYEKGDTGSWASFDTSGWSNFQQLYNSDTNVDYGAFNRNTNPSDPLDFSWGKYNVGTHTVTGDSLYILVFRDQSQNITMMKKFWIVNQTSSEGNINIKMADVDGSNEYTEEIQNNNGADYNLTYYNLRTNKVVNRAPKKSEWDITFTRYYVYLGPHSPVPYYPTMGIVSNYGVKVAEIRNTLPDSVHWWGQAANASGNHYVIGSDWKSFDNGWQLEDSLSYIIYPKGGGTDYYHIYFSSFGGSGTGEVKFMQNEKHTSVDENELSTFSIYPNPASNGVVNIVSPSELTDARIEILDLSGKVISTLKQNHMSQGEVIELPISDISNGYYFVRISSNNASVIEKLVINQ